MKFGDLDEILGLENKFGQAIYVKSRIIVVLIAPVAERSSHP